MIHLIGNAHLDPAWMWQLEEGYAAFAATCRAALDRIEEFPDLIFTCSSAAHYAFIEETDPGLFERIREAVQTGNWCILGGWWVEPDCNLPSGESFVRQALLGQRFFLSRFGKRAEVGYNIDSFGHNANLPQLLKKAGLSSYVFMRPEQIELPLAAALFDWVGVSTDIVRTYRLPLHYSNHRHTVRKKLALLPEFELYRHNTPWMIFFGVGNHGGGPTIEQLRQIEEIRNERSDVLLSDPERFFRDTRGVAVPAIQCEMQPHAIGCYSAHSEIKQLHRRCEQALLRAERLQVLRHHVLGGDTLSLEQGWKNLCLNQFHDLLGGVAIRAACDEAVSQLREAIALAERSFVRDASRIAAAIDTGSAVQNLVLLNPSGTKRDDHFEFELWHPHASERGDILESVYLESAGETFECQKIEPSGKIGEDRVRFLSRAPIASLGWRSVAVHRGAVPPGLSQLAASTTQITNGLVSFGFEDADIVHQTALVLNDPSDTWSHGLHAYTDVLGEFVRESVQVIEQGPLRCGIRVVSTFGDSALEEEFFLYADRRHVECRVMLDWRERHKLLKLRYRHKARDPVATYEIPYASLERPIAPNEWPGQTWVRVNERSGEHALSVITDSKYSYSCDEQHIYVTAARSALFAHHVPPHTLREGERLRFLDQGIQEFRLLLVPPGGDVTPADLVRMSESLHQPIHVHYESAHAGHLSSEASMLSIEVEGLTLGALKRSEDGAGTIVRIVERNGKSTSGTFTVGECTWEAEFTPFEIKTFLIREEAVEMDLLERPI